MPCSSGEKSCCRVKFRLKFTEGVVTNTSYTHTHIYSIRIVDMYNVEYFGKFHATS
jgi:hypothetical protein